jgi:hypothetical protein
MKHSNVWKLLALLVAASMALSACGGAGGEVAPQEEAVSGEIVTSSGFVCPLPEPKLDVTSTELNLFVWTEYIPVEMQECF